MAGLCGKSVCQLERGLLTFAKDWRALYKSIMVHGGAACACWGIAQWGTPAVLQVCKPEIYCKANACVHGSLFLGDKIRYGRIALAVLMVIILLLTACLLLSLIKHTNIEDLRDNNQTLYHNTRDVTLLLGGEFDARVYDKFTVSLISKSTFGFSAIVCQVQCSPQILNHMPLNHTDTFNITNHHRTKYIEFAPEEDNDIVPARYMLKGSEVKFAFELQDVTNSSEVVLNIFTDVQRCVYLKKLLPNLII